MMIQFDRVTKRYSGGQEALKEVSFHLEKGEMLFLTGHSGAGKSTVLKLISLIERPTSGQILIDGHNLNRIDGNKIAYMRRYIGIIFQQPRLLVDRTVFDNVALPLQVSGTEPRELAKRVRASLDKVGLLTKERRNPASLSTGEQQRVGIARALVNRPPVLVADEPTGNLDPYLAAETMNLFDQLNQIGTAILIVSHDLSLIATLKHRVMTLKQGRLVNDGH
jgi:cell division transport system ATP-binding protein